MPISPIVLQRRQAELGRIRLGQKEATSNGKTRPAKLDRFRFTSVSEQYIRDLAELYGGTCQSWDNNGIPSWEVVTEATSIPVIVVKGGLSQWMETWSGGGCAHRCNGEHQVDGTPCDPQDRNHVNAKPTTRLSVMLPELEAIGVFRMETHGWNAAAEIPAVAELAQFVGDLVPAVLHLVERRAIKDGKTSRFVVPVLDLQIGAAKLREIVAEKSGLTELGAPAAASAPALEAARPDYIAEAKAASTLDEVRAVWKRANDAGHMTDDLSASLVQVGEQLGTPAIAQPTPPATADDEVHDAEVVDEDREQLWQQVVTTGGKLDMSLWDLESTLKDVHGITPPEATVEQLQSFLHTLKSGEVPA